MATMALGWQKRATLCATMRAKRDSGIEWLELAQFEEETEWHASLPYLHHDTTVGTRKSTNEILAGCVGNSWTRQAHDTQR